MARTRKPAAVSLAWEGRTFVAGAQLHAARLQVKEAAQNSGPRHRLLFGQADRIAAALGCVDSARNLKAERVRIAYLDPPYASQADYTAEARLDGNASGRVRRTTAYEDKWSEHEGGLGAYLDMLGRSLDAMARLLRPDGTLWVHLDWRAAYFARVLCDEIFGRAAFRNEIIWKRAPNLGRQATSGQFGRTLDTLLVYGMPKAVLVPPKRREPIARRAVRSDEQGRYFTTAPRGDYTDASIERLDREGRIYRSPEGKAYVKYFAEEGPDGELYRERPVDAMWTDIAPMRHASASERTGFPTQKPLALLERIIASASDPGDTVLDLFSGSGTTFEAAHRLGRRAVVGDAGAVGLSVTRARMLRVGAAYTLQADAEAEWPESNAGVIGYEHESADAPVRMVCDDAGVRVVRAAEDDPLAWAALATGAAGEPIIVAHSGRSAGKIPVPPALELALPRAADRLRIYRDDGRIEGFSLGAAPAHYFDKQLVPLVHTAAAEGAGADRVQLDLQLPDEGAARSSTRPRRAKKVHAAGTIAEPQADTSLPKLPKRRRASATKPAKAIVS